MASVKTNDELHFIPPPVQTEFKTHYITPVLPLGTDRNASTITFKVANHTPNTFIDCSGVQLMVELERKHGNTSLTKTQTDGIVNNIMHSLWEDVEVRLNHQLIERDNHLYPWKSFIQQATTWTKADKELLGNTIGYQMDDDPDAMDAVAEIDAAVKAQSNTTPFAVTWPTDGNALYVRNGMFLKGTNRATATSYWLQGHLHAAPFNTNFIMPPGIDVQIDLKRSNDMLCLMSPSSTTDHYIPVVKDIRLGVKYVTVTEEVYNEKIRQMDSGLSIPLPRYQVTQHVIPQQQTIYQSLLTNQKLPSKVYMCFLDNDALSGNKTKNPFNFKNFTLQKYEIRVGGHIYPNSTQELDFENEGTLVEAYLNLLGAIGARKLDGLGGQISMKKFMKGTTILGVDLTAGMDQGEDVMHVTPPGDMDMYLRFKTAPEDCTMLLFCHYNDGAIVLDKHRNVSTTW